MRTITLGAVVCVLAVAGCSSSQEVVDHDAWADDLAPLVADVAAVDFDALADVWADVCTSGETAFAGFVAAAVDGGTDPQVLRVNARHGCPGRAGELDATLTQLGH